MGTLPEIAEALRCSSRVLVASHISPDPDAVGSSLGLAWGLRALGKTVDLFLADGIPERLRPLREGEPVLRAVPNTRYDAIVSVDTATQKRLGRDAECLLCCGERVLNIDHHLSNSGWGDVAYIDPHASSTSEIVIELLGLLGIPLSAAQANILLAGIMDDTGCFRFSNTTPEALERAAGLLRAGASPLNVGVSLYFSVPEQVVRLRARVLSSLQLFAEGRLCLVAVSRALLEEVGASDEDCENLVDEARALSGVVIAVLARELGGRESGRWKISLRSKDQQYDLNTFASQFGGGGHRAAAGCTIACSEEALPLLLIPKLEQLLAEAS